ncbi:ABC transporter permease [Acutalibacter intestini]|uniref:ABC transporter permease n=1 Tax=Acutalibacter intestini TaxID=3093659 RepID=UPI002AC9C979|nr:FtsX-like permease family protein [Acutalibacter sp. M00204]
MIFRLARLQISSHRLRTTFVAVAVVLTTVLYMTVISFAYCSLDSVQLSKMLASGSDIHASIFDMGYSISGEALREEIQRAPEVSETFLMSFEPVRWVEPAEANSVEQGFGMLFVDREKILPHLFMTLTEGRFPQGADETLLCREVFPTLSIGDQVRFFIKSVKVAEPMERTYTVSGFYHSDADVPPPAVALYGEHVAEELELSVIVQFHSSFGIDRRLDAVVERLSQWETPGEERRSQINYAFVAADLGSLLQPGTVLLMLLVIGVLFFAAFLLIYNVYSIALTQDMRSFGLLKVIGMTHRQMKKLTLMQTGLIACGALPVGLLLGYFIGFKLLSPIFISMSGEVLPNRFSPMIALTSAGLTLFTLFFSALRPLARIKKMTPIQSVSPEPESKAPKKEKRREAGASPRSLAMAGLRRSRGRMLVTSLSAMVSVLLFILVGAFTEIDTMVGGKQLGMFDVELGLWDGDRNGLIPEELTKISKFAAVEPDILDSLATSDNVEETRLLRFQQIDADITPGLAEEIRDFMAGSEYDFVRKEYQDILDCGSVKAAVLGIPDELCREIVVSQEDRIKPVCYDGEELYDGRHILCISTESDGQEVYLNLRLSSGDPLSLSRDYSVIHLELPSGLWTALGKICGRLTANSAGVEEMFFLLPESVFEREFPDAPAFTVLVNAKEGMEDALLKEVQALTEGRGVGSGDTRFEYLVGGKLTNMKALQERLGAIQLTGYSLCGIIFLIGLMNMVNSALTSTVLRRREFAMLETVGMTRGQLRRMMVYENSAGGVFGLAAFVVGSALSNALLARVFDVKVSAISLPAVGILLLLFAIGGVAAEFSYRLATRASLTERVKCEE